MKVATGGICCGLMLSGCGLAKDAVVTSYHVATAPVKVARWALKDRSSDDDVKAPDIGLGETRTTAASKPRDSNSAPPKIDKSRSGTAASTLSPVTLPTAKPVPGKPGYVYSPYRPGKYVDVTGYTPGSKVKDPYVQKIFIVP